MNVICQLVVLLCFFTTATAQINFPNTKIKYVVSGDTLTHPYYRNVSLDRTSEHIFLSRCKRLFSEAKKREINFGWSLIIVPGVEHDNKLIAPHVRKSLFN